MQPLANAFFRKANQVQVVSKVHIWGTSTFLVIFDQNYFECLCASGHDTGHRHGRARLKVLLWFMQSFSSQPVLNLTMRNSHSTADSGGLSFPSSLNFVILIHMPVKWLGSIKIYHVESISPTSDKIILSFKEGIFPDKQLCWAPSFPGRFDLHPCFYFFDGPGTRDSVGLRKLLK